MPSLNHGEVNARPIFNRTIFNRPIVTQVFLALVVFLSLVVFSPRADAQMTSGRAATNSFGPGAQPATGAFATAAGSVRLATGPVITPTAPMHHSTAPANSTGPNAVNSRVTFSTGGHSEQHHRHHGRDGDDSRAYAYPAIYGFAYPYPVEPYAGDDSSPADNTDAADDPDYQGGPTVFDRRGSGEDSYIPPVEDVSKPHSGQLIADTTPQAATLLIFKDGHKIEVENYAIVGETLFDLTPGHARRVALASLDLDATRQQNEDRGVIFQLPGTLPGN